MTHLGEEDTNWENDFNYRIGGGLVDDDDDSITDSSTFVSHHSDKLAFGKNLDAYPGLDEYILDGPGDQSTIFKLGSHQKKMDQCDWDQDVNFPVRLEQSKTPPRNDGDCLYKIDRDRDPKAAVTTETFISETSSEVLPRDTDAISTPAEPSVPPESQKRVHFQSTKTEYLAQQPPVSVTEDEDICDGLCIPQNMVFENKVLENKANKQSESGSVNQEQEGAFEEGLELGSSNAWAAHKHYIVQSQPKTRSPLRSHPVTPPQLPRLDQTAQVVPTGSRAPLRFRFAAPTIASRQRQNAMPQSPQPSRTSDTQSRPQFVNVIRKAKTTKAGRLQHGLVYGDGSELDSMDLLPVWTPARVGRKQSLPEHKLLNDQNKIWHENIRRSKLIQQHERPETKEYNNMKFDEMNRAWKGNEGCLRKFDLSGRRNSPLIQQRGIKGRRIRVGDMEFDLANRTWKSSKNQDEDALATIEALEEDGSRNAMLDTGRSQLYHVFNLSKAKQSQFYKEEKKHRIMFQPWASLNSTRAGPSQYAFLLYDGQQ